MKSNLSLDQLRENIRYSPETGVFVWLKGHANVKAGRIAGTTTKTRHRQVHIFGQSILSHRLAWFYMTGSWPKHQIDHINGDRLDNRWVNLREATKSQNGFNRPKQRNNKCGLKGVYWNKNAQKWAAQIMVNSRRIFLGYFPTAEIAHVVYVESAQRLHGEFARTE